MSRPGVTQDQVFAAAQALADHAQPVTVQALREALGQGSFTTLSQHLRAWRSHSQTRFLPPLPPEIEAAAHKALTLVWTAASELAQREVQAARTATSAEIAQSQAQAQETLQEIARLERTTRDQEDQIATLRPALTAAETTLAAHIAKAGQLEARIVELKADWRRHGFTTTSAPRNAEGFGESLRCTPRLHPPIRPRRPDALRQPRPDLITPPTQRAKTIDGS